ncbi:MAG: hypothetical protein SFY95_06770 [Planctomycetota bacterium]|nr:hypothetical protein [Planctomycetota bacterium]
MRTSEDLAVKFGTRPLTEVERRELADPVYFRIKSLWWERAIACLGWLLLVALLVGMAGACYLGSTGMVGLSKAATLAGGAVCALAALYVLYRAIRALRPLAPELIRPALPPGVTEWQTARVPVLAALHVLTADDDAPTLLIRTSEGADPGYFVLYGDDLDDLWPNERSAWKRLPEMLEIRRISGVTWRAVFEGPARIPVGTIEVFDLPEPPGSAEGEPPWYYRDHAVVREAELGPEVVARIRKALGPVADPG